jgi:dCMP deaminase
MKHSDWDRRWLDLCDLVAGWSKDRSSKFGCVIVNDRQSVLSLGWNGFPRGIDDEVESRHERPEKYLWTEHAERNAIYNAAGMGVVLAGATAYVDGVPCSDCARAIIQSGIRRVVMTDKFLDTFAESQQTSLEMFAEAGIETSLIKR